MTLPYGQHAPLDAATDLSLLDFKQLFPELCGPSWEGWNTVLARLGPQVREFYAVCGRGAGKSRIVALLACWYASREYHRAAGENIYVGIFAPDRKQAGITFRYVRGLLKNVPELAALIVRETADSIELSNGVIIEVVTASTAAPRGRAYCCAIVEEAAYLAQDGAADPDVELLRALRPALARVPGSLLAVVSSPYARRGVLWDAWKKYHEQSPAEVLFIQAATLELNPLFDAGAIARAVAEDPASANAEYYAQFRSDVESYIPREAVDAVVVPGRYELAPDPGAKRFGFLDFAGGGVGGDSAVLGIARVEQRDGRRMAILELLREMRPPFSPESVCGEFAATLLAYGIERATADRWAGQFPVEQMRNHGIRVEPSVRSKSDLYCELLPLINSASCELLDHERLIAQLTGLERRTARGGRDSVDHAPGGHDDVCNAAAGALVLASCASAQQGVYAFDFLDGRSVSGDGTRYLDEDEHPYDVNWIFD